MTIRHAETAGAFFVRRIRNRIRKLGLAGVTCSTVPDRSVIQLRWPHRTLDRNESVEFPIDSVWVDRILEHLELVVPAIAPIAVAPYVTRRRARRELASPRTPFPQFRFARSYAALTTL